MQEVSERLVSKIIRTGDYCAQHYTGNTPITHYYFLGEIDMFAPFMDLAQNMIPGGVKLFEPLTRDMPGALPALPEKRMNTVLSWLHGVSRYPVEIGPRILFIPIRTNKSRSAGNASPPPCVWQAG